MSLTGINVPYPPSVRGLSLSSQRHVTWQYQSDCKRMAAAQIKKSSFLRMAITEVIEKGQPIRLALDFYPSNEDGQDAFTFGEPLVTEALARAFYMAEAVPQPIDSVNDLIVIEKKLEQRVSQSDGFVRVTIYPALRHGGESE